MQASIDAATPIATVRACLEQLGHTLGIARRLVRAGKRVDLTGLDAEMGFVCARTLDLSPEDGRAVRPALIELQTELDALWNAVTAHGTPHSVAKARGTPPPG